MIHWQRYFAQNMALAAALAGCALAQETVSIAGAHEFSYVRTEIGPGDKAVKGAPYTAEAITETVQTLANGNHIVHKTSAQLARDNEGRTRREQTVDAVGPWASTGGEPLKLITLNDPVAGVTYHLDPKTNSATKFAYPKNVPPPPPGAPSNFFYAAVPDGPVAGAALSKLKAEAVTTTAFAAGGIATGPGVALSLRMKEPGEVKTEQLAPQRIGDLQATGTRTTRTIPAGAIGNEQPIEITSETWYSPDLQMVVMSKHSDPQIGETTYTLTNIQRGAPPASLFEVPANYTVREEQVMFDGPVSAPSK